MFTRNYCFHNRDIKSQLNIFAGQIMKIEETTLQSNSKYRIKINRKCII